MAPHSSTLAWKIPWTGKPSRLQSMGSGKSRTRLRDFTFTFHFHALEKEMATHSSVLAWRIPGMGEPVGLTSMGSHRVRHNWSDLAVGILPTMTSYHSGMTSLFSRLPQLCRSSCFSVSSQQPTKVLPVGSDTQVWASSPLPYSLLWAESCESLLGWEVQQRYLWWMVSVLPSEFQPLHSSVVLKLLLALPVWGFPSVWKWHFSSSWHFLQQGASPCSEILCMFLFWVIIFSLPCSKEIGLPFFFFFFFEVWGLLLVFRSYSLRVVPYSGEFLMYL